VKKRGWTVLLVVLVVVAACIVADAIFGTRPSVPQQHETRTFPCVKTVLAYAALAEKPTAKRVLLLGDAAESFRDFFENAGLECVSEVGGEPYDMVFASGGRHLKTERAARRLLKPDGLWAECVDVRDMELDGFRKVLASIPDECVHVWMPGELDWLLTGRRSGAKPGLDDMLSLFSREEGFPDLTAARCDSLPALFASYVGTREDLLPAFSPDSGHLQTRPEFFVPRKVPEMDWVDVGGVDADIRSGILKETRSVQLVRRMLLVGVIEAERGDEERSVETWAKVALRNPGDTMLVERLDRLSVNAQAFLKLGKAAMAARCYDTMAQMTPNDPMPVYNYAICMRQMGETKIAELAFKHADELAKALEEKSKEADR
jgi:tetratricopeptide (TPR) repeat protein